MRLATRMRQARLPWGIRLRITTVAAASTAAVLGVTAVGLVTAQQRALTANLDDQLLLAASDLAGTRAAGELPALLPSQVDDDGITQVVSLDGEVLAVTASADGLAPLAPPGGDHALRTVALLPGEPDYRLLSQRSGDVVIHTGAPVDDVAESVAALRLGLALTLPAAVVILAGLVWWLVGRTLRPVEAIRSEVAEISARNLGRRVSEPAADDEIRRLARTMNDMLDRVQAALDRQQRFVADASHELRSPLTRIRTELEVDALHPATADLASTHRSVLDETRQLQMLVDDLLFLARHDATAPIVVAPQPVQLDDIVLDEARRLRGATGTRPVMIDTTTVSAAQVLGSSGALVRAIRNVLDNAGRYAATTVTVSLAETDNRARLTISDDGPGIDPAHHDQVFQRFTRLDPARARTSDAAAGTGLGLAIAHDIIAAHDGTITLDPGYSAGARFVIDLPATPAAAPAPLGVGPGPGAG